MKRSGLPHFQDALRADTRERAMGTAMCRSLVERAWLPRRLNDAASDIGRGEARSLAARGSSAPTTSAPGQTWTPTVPRECCGAASNSMRPTRGDRLTLLSVVRVPSDSHPRRTCPLTGTCFAKPTSHPNWSSLTYVTQSWETPDGFLTRSATMLDY